MRNVCLMSVVINKLCQKNYSVAKTSFFYLFLQMKKKNSAILCLHIALCTYTCKPDFPVETSVCLFFPYWNEYIINI